MIDTPTHANIADFKQRYQGVMGWLHSEKADKGKSAVVVSSVTANKVTFKDSNDNEYYANVDTGVQFEFVPTQRAFYNTADTVFLVQRIPARQWKRGICVDNTDISELINGVLIGQPTTVNWRKAAFSVMTSTLPGKEALSSFFEGGRSSVALSKYFALSGNSLFFLTLLAGEFNKKTKTITLFKEFQMIRQELGDLINRNNYPFKVAE